MVTAIIPSTFTIIRPRLPLTVPVLQEEDQPIYSGENIFYGVIEDRSKYQPRGAYKDFLSHLDNTILQVTGPQRCR
jgi:hypothetical protein